MIQVLYSNSGGDRWGISLKAYISRWYAPKNRCSSSRWLDWCEADRWRTAWVVNEVDNELQIQATYPLVPMTALDRDSALRSGQTGLFSSRRRVPRWRHAHSGHPAMCSIEANSCYSTASTSPRLSASWASRYQLAGAFSSTSSRVMSEPFTRF